MDTVKIAEQLRDEVAALRRRVAELEDAHHKAQNDIEERITSRTAALTESNAALTRELEDLRWAEERFAKAFHCNPSPMAISTSENGFLEVNQAFLDTLQYGRDEVIGATAADLGLFVNPGRQLAAVSIITQEGRLRDFALDVRTKSGHIRHGSFSGEIIQLHDQQFMLTVMADVTERRQAEKAVRESEARLQFAQHIAKIGTFEWDVQKGGKLLDARTGGHVWIATRRFSRYASSLGETDPSRRSGWGGATGRADPEDGRTGERRMACDLAGWECALAGRALAGLSR